MDRHQPVDQIPAREQANQWQTGIQHAADDIPEKKHYRRRATASW